MFDWFVANSAFLLPLLAVASVLFLILCAILLIAWVRARRAVRGQFFDRVEAERERIDLELSLAEQTGRLRIIREQHDVAVHSLSVIISQAEGARYSGEQDPTAAVRTVGVIEDAARETLADLRRVMTVVREGEADAPPEPAVGSESDLFAVMRDAGLVIAFEESGERFELRGGAELAIYRILQEALSNSLTFGGEGTEVLVSYAWTEEGLRVSIDDDGVRAQYRREGLDPNEASKQRNHDIAEDLSALTDEVSGVGISEMRERAALFGGLFNAQPVPGVGFSVSVVFPALKYHNGIHGVNLNAGADDGEK